MARTEDAVEELRRRWAAGDRVPAERFTAADPDALLDLIYAEVLLREAAGERPGFDEYAARFPALAEPLRVQFEVHEAIEGDADPSGSAGDLPAPGIRLRLVRVDGGAPLALRANAGGVVLGRSSGCDVVLTEQGVSRRHCRLMAGDGLFVEDLESRHGTAVNGEPIRGLHRLRSGDELRLARVAFRVEFPA